MNILIVDDQPANLKLMRVLLEAEGAAVSEAADGVEALGVLGRVGVDAVISDIVMPRMDGYQLCKEMRANPMSCDVPFIAYSAAGTSPGEEKRMAEMGADRILRKPASAAVFAGILDEVLEKRFLRASVPGQLRSGAGYPTAFSSRIVENLQQQNGELESRLDRLTQAGGELNTTNRQLQRLLDYCPAMVYSLKSENRKMALRAVSGDIAHFLGFDEVGILSYDWWVGRLHPTDRITEIAGTSGAVMHGASFAEYRLMHKDGTYRWVEDCRRGIPGRVGEPLEFIGVWTNITAQKSAEQGAKEQRGQWQTLVAMAMNALLVFQDGKLVLVNPSAIRLLAATSEAQLLGRDVRDFIHAEDFALIEARARSGLQPQGSAQPLPPQKMYRVDRSMVEVALSPVRFQFQGRPALLVEARDLSESKRAGSRLAVQHTVAAALAEETSLSKINEGVLAALVCGLEWDYGELWMIDRSTEVLHCTDVWHLPSAEYPEFASANRTRGLAKGQEWPGRVWYSATTEWCADISKAADDSRHHHASRLGLRSWMGFPIKLGHEVVGVVGFFGRKTMPPDAELVEFCDTCGLQIGQLIAHQQLANQFRQSQKMEALGTLAGGIAHDFNNILGAIYRYCEMAQMEAGGNAVLTEHLRGLMGGAQRATALVARILAFSGPREEARRLIHLRPIALEAMQLLRAALPSTIEFVTSLSEDAPMVSADATQVHQILMNLGINAAHAMRERGGQLVVKLENCLVDSAFASNHPDLHVGDHARLTVRDNGHGMDRSTLNRTFEPFFTTKAPGEGTGLGLAVVHDIVKAHEGAIIVSSVPGEGTTFQIYFPAHSANAEKLVT